MRTLSTISRAICLALALIIAVGHTPLTAAPSARATAQDTRVAAQAGCPVGQFEARYYANRTFAGVPLTRCESRIDYDWGAGGPGGGMPTDHFAARWSGRFNFSAGEHIFTVRADDGVRLYLDGALVIDGWKDQGATTYTATRALAAGEHEVRVEYYEREYGAVMLASWAPVSGQTYRFGTLASDHTKSPQEYAAGVRVVELEVFWRDHERREGEYDFSWIVAQMRGYQEAGMAVVLGPGLNHPPDWLFAYPNSRYVDQYGRAADVANFTFSRTLRAKGERYLDALFAAVGGPGQFAAIRVGSGGLSEAFYPGMGGRNAYWAYDAAAQGGADRPASVPPAPFPGWRPGERAYRGRPLAAAEVEAWYGWYLGALVDTVDWQIAFHRGRGFGGDLHLVLPGVGTRPAEYRQALAAHLDGSGDALQTLGAGAVWHLLLDRLPDKRGVVVVISSVGDASGDNGCEAGDRAVDYLHDPQVMGWSSTRWLSLHADRHGLAKIGENPGRGDYGGYGAALLERAARLMAACGLQGLLWAHGHNLYDGASGVTLADYAAAIRRYNAR